MGRRYLAHGPDDLTHGSLCAGNGSSHRISMHYIPSHNDTRPIRPLFVCFWGVGVLAVVPVLSWGLVRLLAAAGLIPDDPRLFTPGASHHVGVWIWLVVWQLGNALWMRSAYLLDARNAQRDAQRQTGAGSSPVILRWRNRLLVNGRRSLLRRITWFCLGPGSRIFVLPVLAVVCSYAAHGFATIEEAPNSPGPQPLFALFSGGIALVLAVMTVQRFWARARLCRSGRVLTGTVLNAGEQGSLWRIDYRFQAQSGEEQAASEYLSYRPARMPSPGDRLAIHHDEQGEAQVM